MSRILAATCDNGVVTCEGVTIASAIKLSEGNGASSGILIMQDDKAYYLPSSAFDLRLIIEKVITSLTTIKAALQLIDLNGYIISSSPDVPGGPKAAVQIASIQTQIDDLNTFKGDLD